MFVQYRLPHHVISMQKKKVLATCQVIFSRKKHNAYILFNGLILHSNRLIKMFDKQREKQEHT